MINNEFDIEELPIFKTIIEESIADSLNEVKENYKLLMSDAYKLASYSLNEKLYLPTAYYNLLFYVEISLKYYLLIQSELTITQIENYGHNIPLLINKIKKKNKSIERLKFLISKIKMKNGKKLDITKYYNYKYNKEMGNAPLIFDFEMNKNEQNMIKEVIEWVSSHI